MTHSSVIFQSNALRVEYDAGVTGTIWVTFGARDLGGAFGRAFIAKRRDAGIYFIPREDHWYQVPEIWDAIENAKPYSKGVNRLIAYGSSMGGFAALAFAKEFAPDLVIAASPQCSICPSIVGAFDRRWADRAQKTTFQRRDCRDGLEGARRIFIIYDPLHSQDRKNVALIATAAPVQKIGFPLAGHGSLHTLNGLGLLPQLVNSILSLDDTNITNIQSLYRMKARSGFAYYQALGEHFQNRGNNRRATEFYLRSLARFEANSDVFRALTDTLWSLGYRQEAVRTAARAVELAPFEGGHVIRYAFALMNVGQLDVALSILHDADKKFPEAAAILNALSIAYRQKHDLQIALHFLERAVVLDPFNSVWSSELEWLRAET